MKRKLKRLNKLKLSKAFGNLNRNTKFFTITGVFYGGTPNRSIRSREIKHANKVWNIYPPLARRHFKTRGVTVTVELHE